MKKHPVLIFLLFFALISIFAVISSDPLITVTNYPLEYGFKQIQWYIIAFLAIYCLAKVSNLDLFKLSWLGYWLCLLAVFLLALQHQITISGSDLRLIPFSRYVNGATSWFEIPGIGSIQPSEFLKIAYLMVLSDVLYRHKARYPVPTLKNEVIIIGKTILLTALSCSGILLQNDSGVTLILCAGMLGILVVSPIRARWLIGGSVIIIVLGLLAYYGLTNYLQAVEQGTFSYRIGRILGWLDPESYYQSYGYQLFNALLSSTTAGFNGHGFQSIVMSLPEAHTDFIFTVILAGCGWLIGALIILFMLAFNGYLIYLAGKTDQRERYFFAGLVGMLFFQQFWNIAMNLGLVPITGITLPLISYGGSSLLSYMAAFALVFNFERECFRQDRKTHFFLRHRMTKH